MVVVLALLATPSNHPSWRYADPRANLFSDAEWGATRPIVCRALGLPPDPQPMLESLAVELDNSPVQVPSSDSVRWTSRWLSLAASAISFSSLGSSTKPT